MKLKSVRILGDNYPYNEKENRVNYEGEWIEIQEDQEGDHYFLYKGSAIPIGGKQSQPQDESQKELFTGESWKVDETGGIIEPFDIISNNGKLISSVKWGTKQTAPETFEEVKANAYLQAASPDMYRALKDAIERMDRARNILQKDENSQWGMLDTANLKLALQKATPNK